MTTTNCHNCGQPIELTPNDAIYPWQHVATEGVTCVEYTGDDDDWTPTMLEIAVPPRP